tara:strand:- start:3617 stop:4072 length:456 start_codon:yes stop_codon:yes gene_type:complete
MDRITKADLRRRIAYLNRITGHAEEPYKLNDDGTIARETREGRNRAVVNAGTYTLSGAYGGWNLCQMTRGGGERNVFSHGHVAKRELWREINAYIEGIESRPSGNDILSAILKHSPDIDTSTLLAIGEELDPVADWIKNMSDAELIEALKV